MDPALNKIRNLTFEITNQCNLHCRICNIWKERPWTYLPLSGIKRMLSAFSGLSNVSLTGGEPLLHPGINALYRYLYSLCMKKQLRGIDIATNASFPIFTSFLKKHRHLLEPLSLSISLDGLGETHDLQRGTHGAFTRVIKNICYAQTYRIPITIKFVASSLNYKQLVPVAKLARELGCKFDFKLIEKVPAYYHRKLSGRLPMLNSKQKKELAKAILTLPDSKQTGVLEALSLSWHKKYFQQGNLKFIGNCLTPERTLFVTAHGEIYNCLYQEKIGTLEEWPAALNRKVTLKNIKNGHDGTCPKCLSYHGSLKTYNVLPKERVPYWEERIEIT